MSKQLSERARPNRLLVWHFHSSTRNFVLWLLVWLTHSNSSEYSIFSMENVCWSCQQSRILPENYFHYFLPQEMPQWERGKCEWEKFNFLLLLTPTWTFSFAIQFQYSDVDNSPKQRKKTFCSSAASIENSGKFSSHSIFSLLQHKFSCLHTE